MQSKNKLESSDIKIKVVSLARCSKVVKGGRKFSFSVLSIAGNSKGMIGIGLGRANELADAKDKSEQNARKSMVRIPLRDGRTLHHDIRHKFCSGVVEMRSAPPGTGIIAGGAVRTLLESAGFKDAVVKLTSSTNPHNALKAALGGLMKIRPAKKIAEKRGKKVSQILGNNSSKDIG
jgi:small subunit ribosomal protein S5